MSVSLNSNQKSFPCGFTGSMALTLGLPLTHFLAENQIVQFLPVLVVLSWVLFQLDGRAGRRGRDRVAVDCSCPCSAFRYLGNQTFAVPGGLVATAATGGDTGSEAGQEITEPGSNNDDPDGNGDT